MNIIIAVLFFGLFAVGLSGAYLIVCDKQKAWKERNRDQ
jgi:hypothetical protein|tara:strand:- start:2465 stop:2581 length:117 start_codon:yes stop_codon:yes gene_type:complete